MLAGAASLRGQVALTGVAAMALTGVAAMAMREASRAGLHRDGLLMVMHWHLPPLQPTPPQVGEAGTGA